MRSRMRLGDFLVAYLRRAGVTHIFGLPGDLVLFHRFGRFGGVGIRAETRQELREALRAAHEVRDFVIVECIVPKDDASSISRRDIRASARRSEARRR